jgi:hypothetical protein
MTTTVVFLSFASPFPSVASICSTTALQWLLSVLLASVGGVATELVAVVVVVVVVQVVVVIVAVVNFLSLLLLVVVVVGSVSVTSSGDRSILDIMSSSWDMIPNGGVVTISPGITISDGLDNTFFFADCCLTFHCLVTHRLIRNPLLLRTDVIVVVVPRLLEVGLFSILAEVELLGGISFDFLFRFPLGSVYTNSNVS